MPKPWQQPAHTAALSSMMLSVRASAAATSDEHGRRLERHMQQASSVAAVRRGTPLICDGQDRARPSYIRALIRGRPRYRFNLRPRANRPLTGRRLARAAARGAPIDPVARPRALAALQAMMGPTNCAKSRQLWTAGSQGNCIEPPDAILLYLGWYSY